jgi:hypothetical protein
VTLEDRITDEVRALERLDLEGLRAEWRRRYGPPPTLRSRDLLARMLAWRIQAEAFGGLDADLAKRLRRGVGLSAARSDVSLGTRLVREWQGEPHEVEALENGFRYRGTLYRSLSAVARQITGVKWNGRRFFGLDKEPAR